MKKILLISIIVMMLIPFNNYLAYDEVDSSSNDEYSESFPYPTLDDLMKELKEKRKQIEQQRLEEIKAKKLEKGELLEEDSTTDDSSKKADEHKEQEAEKQVVPSLIVRLRGKHSTKYLCSYNFKSVEDTTEKTIAKDIITDYEKLLKKSSLKVRANENINFEFSREPKELSVSIWNLDNKQLSVKRGCIKVPDLEGKYILLVKGTYKDGSVTYAVILDIRK